MSRSLSRGRGLFRYCIFCWCLVLACLRRCFRCSYGLCRCCCGIRCCLFCGLCSCLLFVISRYPCLDLVFTLLGSLLSLLLLFLELLKLFIIRYIASLPSAIHEPTRFLAAASFSAFSLSSTSAMIFCCFIILKSIIEMIRPDDQCFILGCYELIAGD